MNVTLITPAGIQDIDAWAGKTISLTVDSVTAFTGVVDNPQFDIVNKRVTLFCGDKRREILDKINVSSIGFYSNAIFSDVENTIEELDQRLQTITSAADIKPDGTYAITDINPKATPDITLLNADVYRRTPSVKPVSRTRLTNQINLEFKLRYTRLRHRDRSFKIQGKAFCDEMALYGKFTSKENFINYSNQQDWVINENSLVWEELPPSQWLDWCPGTDFAWITNPYYAISLTYDATTQFSQTITETFNITVKAPQSISQYGLIEWNQKNGYDIEFDAAEWENYKRYRSPTGGTADTNDYYIDEDGLSTDYDNAILTAINIANTKIIRSHRDIQAEFETDLSLNFELTKTILLSTTPLTALGKVTNINHMIDITNRYGVTKTEISLSTAQGVQVPDAITVPARLTMPVIADPFSTPEIMLIDDGNVVTPEIDDTSRDEQEVIEAINYDIEIQNNDFSVVF